MNITDNTLRIEDNIQIDEIEFDLDQNIDIRLDSDFNQNENMKNEPIKNDKPEKLLTDEIRSFRKKNKEFAATNDHETYLIICFSTKEDKKEFLQNVRIDTHTLVDGYELARNIKIEPARPKFKLAKPLTKEKR